MRISDWSSDVCSSDLRTKLEDGLSENTAELVLIGCDTGAIEMAVRLSGKDKSDDRFSVPGAMIVDVFEDIVEPGHGFRVNVPRCPAQRVAEALPTLILTQVLSAAPSEPRGIVEGLPRVASLGFLLVQV